MSCTQSTNCACGCCSGISVQTPQMESNLPGLSSVAYRTGTWSTFKQSMLARLSSADYPALSRLKTRDDDDFSIAFLDATSVVLDILTFYQERLLNESYIRTATQLQSLTELARLIGYQPAPGISASTYLAFNLKAATGLPTDPTTSVITIPKGSQVQSVPAQGQTPQSFETSADLLAKADWNALPVQTGTPWVPATGDTSVYLQGTATQLQPGDAILVVGDERVDSNSSQQWDLRLVTSIQADSVNRRTLVTWSGGLGDAAAGIDPAQLHAKFYALRQRAALFGYNAINPVMLAPATVAALDASKLLNSSKTEWNFGINSIDGSTLASDSLVDLDAVYSRLTTGGWLALIEPDKQNTRSPAGLISLFLIQSVTVISRSDYAMSGKLSRLGVDSQTHLSDYYSATRSASALTQSEELPVAIQPLDHPLYGTFVDLQVARPDLVGVPAVALTGKSQKLSVNAASTALSFDPDDGSDSVRLNPGDVVTVIEPPPPLNTDGSVPSWRSINHMHPLRVADSNGRTGTIEARLSNFNLAPSDATDPVVQEVALISSVSVSTDPYPHTRIHLQANLLHCYDHARTTVNANVVLATNGRTVSEILGSGSAATPNQIFTLKQSALTFVQSPTPTGRLSTLLVTADSVAWTEAASLYQQGPSQQTFATLNQPGGGSDLFFGDGVEGSTLPTGQNNIHATYRVGSGVSGNVAAGAITTLVDRPLGVSGVVNPQRATGGQDPQSVDDIRGNAPLSVLTLGRAVSITDYQNYAASFAGIAKAYAIWIASGASRGVFLTVAAAGGVALPAGNPTLDNLIGSLRNYGNPNIPVQAQSFLETLFSLSADVRLDPARDPVVVCAAVLQSLRQNYSFAARTFGQGVSADEMEAFIQAVPGVVAVHVTNLEVVATSTAGDLTSAGYSVSAYNAWLAQTVTLPRITAASPTRICPYLPVPGVGALPLPAEILVLDPDPNSVVLGVLA